MNQCNAQIRLIHRPCSAVLAAGIAIIVLLGAPAGAQVLQGEWVKEADQRIDKLRKASLRVLVLDVDGRPVADAQVRMRLRRHAFAFGVRLDAANFRAGDAIDWPKDDDAPLWRCFSAVGLDELTAWPTAQPAKDQRQFQRIEAAVQWAQQRRLMVRWGAMISADVGRLPPWVAPLHGDALREALDRYVDDVMTRFAGRVGQFDVLADTIDHDVITERLGPAMTRRLYQSAHAAAPPTAGDQGHAGARLAVRFDDALTGPRLTAMLRQVTAMKEQFVPIDLIAIDVRLGGTVLYGPLSRALDWIHNIDAPLVVTALEVGGPSPAAAAINLETVLRMLFAQAGVEGVWFAGLRADRLSNPSAALVDAQGMPTPAGLNFDKLVRGQWWTDDTGRTDALGNIQRRVFAGLYDVSVTLPDGSVAQAHAYVPSGSRQNMVVLQPLKNAEADK